MDELKSIKWVGDSLKQIKSFPPEVRREIGVALFDAQKGEKAPTAKPFKGVGSGVFEIAIRFDKDAFRAVYAVQIGGDIYVLHAFQKKSKSGIKTPKREVDLIKRRYQLALMLEQNK